MSSNFSTDVTINAPVTAVWDTLADIGTIARESSIQIEFDTQINSPPARYKPIIATKAG